MKKIFTENAPAPIGPYSQGIEEGGLLFLSGQISIDPSEGKLIDGDITAQTDRICKNIRALLSEAGTDFENVIKTTCYLTESEHFAPFNKVYAEYFTSAPARSCVFVKALPAGALAEIEVTAKV